MFRADGAEAGEYGQRFAAQRTLAIAGRQYVLRTQANAAFEQRVDRSTPSWIVLGGSLLSALLALATWMLASARPYGGARGPASRPIWSGSPRWPAAPPMR